MRGQAESGSRKLNRHWQSSHKSDRVIGIFDLLDQTTFPSPQLASKGDTVSNGNKTMHFGLSDGGLQGYKLTMPTASVDYMVSAGFIKNSVYKKFYNTGASYVNAQSFIESRFVKKTFPEKDAPKQWKMTFTAKTVPEEWKDKAIYISDEWYALYPYVNSNDQLVTGGRYNKWCTWKTNTTGIATKDVPYLEDSTQKIHGIKLEVDKPIANTITLEDKIDPAMDGIGVLVGNIFVFTDDADYKTQTELTGTFKVEYTLESVK